MDALKGIRGRRIAETPIAVLDFETTGLTPGPDRVIEVAVVRLDPGQPPRVALDTLVNPLRPVAATEIHGITNADVAGAPRFEDIAGRFLEAIAGCVVASYNVYFDMKFLEFELRRLSLPYKTPHFCMMYLRPMLELGQRCSLELACQCHGVNYRAAHAALVDTLATVRLWDFYRTHLVARGIETFHELGRLRSYKFVESFVREPLRLTQRAGMAARVPLKSRSGPELLQFLD